VTVVGAPSGILTFLIADVRGYTSFTQAHGDEGAARLADIFAEICHEGVAAHGGEVVELRGDEALAVFTSPRAALRAAVDLQIVFADETALEPELPLRVGIGIDAGEAVPLRGGYRGAALNLAARLCSRAQAGEVLVSQGVAHLARAVDGLTLEQYGEAEVKGIAEPVPVFRALTSHAPLRRPSVRGDLPSALDAVTPMIGREVELRALLWRWRFARRGTVDVVVLQGPAGIGKTRLAAELAKTVAAGGGHCRYASAAFGSLDPTALVAQSPQPALVVFDDLDALPSGDVEALTAALSGTAGALLALLVVDDSSASTEVLGAVHRIAGDERIVRPRPLDFDEMAKVAALYVGGASTAVPRDLLAGTDGVPRRVHEAVSEWAQLQATQRLGTLADAAASGRSGLRDVESDLAGTVIDLQLVREQATLFGLGPGRRAPEPANPPYRGLTSFDVDDAEFFFGRERVVAEMVSQLAGSTLLGVVGASGSGKSSAVRAGLLPALAAGVLPGSADWPVAVMRPGEHPIRSLERALWSALPSDVTERLGDDPLADLLDTLGDGDRVVVVLDQFEEAFTECLDEQERNQFLASIAGAAADPRASVSFVISIRADYYGRCSAEPTLARLLAANQLLVGPMTAEEYRRAITQPALRVGAVIEPELVDDLVAEVLGEPGALPLLSTTLLELWGRRDGRTLRRSTYLGTGGVRGAVARLAEEVYGSFGESEQTTARAILLRLCGPGIGDTVVRRRVPLSQFDADHDESVRHVLDVLADRRLLTLSDGSAEVAHEALLREWPRLQGWLEEDREGRRLRGHLATAAQEWAANQRDEGELYRGARLSAALDWTAQHTQELNELEREFVTSSNAFSTAELTRQQRQNRRLRGLLVGVAGVLVVALVAGGLALLQRSHARTAARVALARQLGAEALTTPRIDQAALLARQAVLLDNSAQTEGTLLATLLRSPNVESTFTTPINIRPLDLALSSDGRHLAVADNSGSVRFYDTATRAPLKTVLATHGSPMVYGQKHFYALRGYVPHRPAAFDVYDVATLHPTGALPISRVWATNPTSFGEFLLVNHDESRAYFTYSLVDPTTRADGATYIESWDLATGNHRVVKLPGIGMSGAALVKNSVELLTDSAVLRLDPKTLRVTARRPTSLGPGQASISPDGRTAAFLPLSPDPNVPAPQTFSLVDLASGHRTPAQGSHTASILGIAFSPDGRHVVTTSDDTHVDVWNPKTGALEETLVGHSARVIGIAFSADGRTLYTSSLDGAIFGWDLGSGKRFGHPFAVGAGDAPELLSPLPPLAVAPDSSRFVARSGNGLGVYSLATLTSSPLPMPKSVLAQSVAWSAGDVVAVGTTQGDVELWNMAGTPRLARTLRVGTGDIVSLAFAADGQSLGVVRVVPPKQPGASGSAEVSDWSVPTGQALGRTTSFPDAGMVAVSADGSRLAVGMGSGIGVLSRTTAVVRKIPDVSGGQGISSLAFAPNGDLLSGSWAGIVERWNIDTGASVARPVLAVPAPVAELAVAPDGARFATAGGSTGGVKLWDTSSLQQFGANFPGGNGAWGNVAYTPDGGTLLAVFQDGTATSWPVDPGAWLAHACSIAGRNFTQEEWKRFVPGQSYQRTCPQFPPGSSSDTFAPIPGG
jgi:class 3 adenylate cyclase/WD40 repeat protein